MAAADDALYPEIEPYDSFIFPVSDLHQLHVEQCGNSAGPPVVFLHGGPGGGSSARDRRYFDPTHYRIIVHDQRGAGRSSPLGEHRENTTELLVEDLERMRVHLGIDRWHVFGGSWGSTLALAYAQAHPDRVRTLTLRGIFLMRRSEVQWFLHGMQAIFPEAARRFREHLPHEERADLLESYWRRLTSADAAVRLAAACAWGTYEAECCFLIPSDDHIALINDPVKSLGIATLEAHYMRNNLFEPDDRLLRGVDRIRHIPTVIVQGRYDIVCPIETADTLHRAWPEAEYHVIADAGHSAKEPGISRALVAAMNRWRSLR